jgi:NADPH2:quinone reductase
MERAEYTICHKQRTLKLPDKARDIPWEVLGAVPMGLWTAYGSIFNSGRTKPGDIVFVHGATSSVGIWAILVCKDRGCTVIASTRQKSKIQKLKDAGADYVVLEEDLETPQTIRQYALNGVNTVLEIIGLHKLKKVSMPALAKYGTCVLMGILGKVWSISNFGADSLPPCHYLTTYTTDEDVYEPSLALLAEMVEKIRTGGSFS